MSQQNVEQAFHDLRWEAKDFLSAEDKVLVTTRMVGRGKQSSAEVSLEVFHVWTIHDSLATELRTLFTRDQALEALGLWE